MEKPIELPGFLPITSDYVLAVDWDDAKIADVFETTPEFVAIIRAEPIA